MLPNNEELLEIQKLFSERKYKSALKRLDKLIGKSNQNVELLINKISILIGMENYFEAKKIASNLLLKNPNNADLLLNLGLINHKIREYDEAIIFYNSAYEKSPELFQSILNLVSLYLEIDDADNAILSLNRVKELISDYDIYHQLIAEAYLRKLQFSKAMEHHEQAVIKNPKNTKNFYLLGTDYLWSGDKVKAKELFLKAIELDNKNAEAYFALTKVERFDKSSSFFHNLLAIKDNKELSDSERSFIYFALFNVYENSKEPIDAFKCLVEANTIRGKIKKFNYKNLQKLTAKIKALYLKKFSTESYLYGIENDVFNPIFILGLPRSGSSLLEQILTNHDLIFGCGEINLIHETLKNSLNNNFDENLVELKEKYINKIRGITNKNYFIDKLPLNFFWIGFILKIFPNAKILHTTRNPYDVFYSLYKNLFVEGALEFSYSQKNIIEFYKEYKLIIKFWNEYLSDKIYEVNYEKLVEEPEAETKKIFEFLNLKYEKKFIDIKANKRWVRTASDTQIRENIQKKSQAEWMQYKDKLDYFNKFFNF